MKSFIVFASVMACACAAPQLIYSGLGGATVLAAAPAVIAPAVTSSQYHAQDELGQYAYGYAGGPSAKSESKSIDGVTRGGYSYVDANGLLQTVNYVADPVNGFRVAATNLPVAPSPLAGPVHIAAVPQQVDDSPEVKLAKIEHFRAVAEAAARAGQ